MDFTEFNIGKNQAEEFAKAIFADIEAYVNEHLEEYEEFLKEYESEVVCNFRRSNTHLQASSLSIICIDRKRNIVRNA